MCGIKIVQKNGQPSRCGKMNKKKDHAETEQRRRTEKKEIKNVEKISDEQSQKATACAPPKSWRIKPDREEDVNPEVLNSCSEASSSCICYKPV